MTLTEAIQSLPADAEWSSSFGNAGEPGCAVYFRTPLGERFEISNGTFDAVEFVRNWSIRRIGA